MRRSAVIVVGMLVTGCRGNDNPRPKPTQSKPATKIGTPVQRGTLRRGHVETSYGVAIAAGTDLAPLKKLAPDALERKFAELFSDGEVIAMTYGMEANEAELLKTTNVLVLYGTGSDGYQLAHELATKAHELATTAHGWVLDVDPLRAYRADDFVKHIPGDHPDVRKLISVHVVGGTGEVPFLDTAGLRRYGYPELYVSQVGLAQVEAADTLVNAVAQTLLNGGDVDPRGTITVEPKQFGWHFDQFPGGTGKATFTAKWALEDDADDEENAVVEIVPAAGASPEHTGHRHVGTARSEGARSTRRRR